MDWGTKLPAWDLPELEHVPEPNIGSAVAAAASSSGSLRTQSGLDFDLKLGGLGDLGSTSRWKDQPRASATPAVPPAGTSKRIRTPSNGSQNVSCLVDGCKSDLSSCREYHRRHKVCEAHSKTPMVLVGGQEQRFCQQCSRFHLLVEFDEVKRSCRKRLDGHNRRRRKPQPEPMNTGSFHLNFQGPRFSLYSHLYPTSTTDPPPTWIAAVKNEEEMHGLHPTRLVDRQQVHFSDSHYCRNRDVKQQHFPFGLQDVDNSSTGISSRTPKTTTVSFSGCCNSNNNNKDNNGSGVLSHVLDSDCALSLLSSPACMASISISPSRMVTVDRIPVAQPLNQGLQHHGGCLGSYSPPQSHNNVVSTTGFSCSGMDGEQASGAVLVPHETTTDSHLQCPGIFHVGGGGSSNASSNVLPFSW